MFSPYYVEEQYIHESYNSRSTNSIYHQSIFSLFSVEKIEQYLPFKTNTKYKKVYRVTFINSNLLFFCLCLSVIYAILSKPNRTATLIFTNHCFRYPIHSLYTPRLTDNWNTSN